MLETIRNAWKIPELRKKLLMTAFIILIFRLGNNIPVPYVDTALLSNYFASSSATIPVSYTHLDVYKRQGQADRRARQGGYAHVPRHL